MVISYIRRPEMLIFLIFSKIYTNSCENNFYFPETVVSEAYCWISSPFLVISELWLAGSTQLFWLKLLSKLTDSICFSSSPNWIALLSPKLTLEICSNLLAPCFSSGFSCLCWPALHKLHRLISHLTQLNLLAQVVNCLALSPCTAS